MIREDLIKLVFTPIKIALVALSVYVYMFFKDLPGEVTGLLVVGLVFLIGIGLTLDILLTILLFKRYDWNVIIQIILIVLFFVYFNFIG